ncbi:MAG TPA: hypothetical protein VGF01_19740 [Terracidiphilus sp.]|jgi:hypothetical protein
MRFETRYDNWLVGVLILAGLILFGVPVTLYSNLAVAVPIWILFIGPVIFVIALSATLPQYYEVREDGLFIRQGWNKALLAYSSLRELNTLKSVLSAPVFSTHRLLVTAVPGGQFLIAVAEQDRFLTEVAHRAPQLEQGPSGLKASGSSPVDAENAAL